MSITKFKVGKLKLADTGIFLLFCLALYFPVFQDLTRMPITIWDESLFSIRALHYLQYGEYMENFNNYAGLPVHQNTKLPFTTFFQVLGLKLFGINELGIRLPIAFIFLATVFYVLYHMKKYFQALSIGYFFGLIMVCSTGFVTVHMLRTGDHDAPFACYLLLSILFFHRYLDSRKSAPLAAFSFFVIAAFLTKNLLAGLIAPGLLIYIILSGKLMSILKDYRIYISVFAIIMAYLGTIFYFEYQFPGFIDRMWNYELMGRYSETIEGHKGGFFHYTMMMFKSEKGFVPFMYFLPISVAIIFGKKVNPQLKQLLLLSFSVFLSYLLIISFSATKTAWYHAPLFPLGALIVAIGMQQFYHHFIQRESRLKIAVFIAALLIFAAPYALVVQNVYKPKPLLKDDKYGNFIEAIAHGSSEFRTFTIVDNNFGTSAYFYKEKFNSKGYNIDYQRSLELEDGQVIITCLNNVFQPVQEQYEIELYYQKDGCRLLKIIGEK